MKKTFSIIIPFYNGEIFYPNLLKSISVSIKNCNYCDIFFEVITIIDSMDTNILDINNYCDNAFIGLSNVRVLNYKNELNIGVAATRNKAIHISNGDYLHIIDQDDEITHDFYFESQIHLKDYNFLLFNGKMCYTHENFQTHRLYYLSPRLSIKGLINDDFIRSPGQVVFSRKLLHENFFPEPKQYKGADDRFFWLRLFIENKNKIRSKYISKHCYIANIHESNYSNNRVNLDRSCLENWNIFISEIDIKAYSKLISRDIIRVRYKLNDEMTFYNRINGFWFQLLFNLKLSKMIRFVVKRSKL
jgi:glycosyltransferase involved in cell wall biosynthesis